MELIALSVLAVFIILVVGSICGLAAISRVTRLEREVRGHRDNQAHHVRRLEKIIGELRAEVDDLKSLARKTVPPAVAPELVMNEVEDQPVGSARPEAAPQAVALGAEIGCDLGP